jgi:hypothetical protein
VDNHLAHYRGWTAVVAFDASDADWMAQAIRATCFSIAEFCDLMEAEQSMHEIADGGFPTKEDALAEIIRKIDTRESGPDCETNEATAS